MDYQECVEWVCYRDIENSDGSHNYIILYTYWVCTPVQGGAGGGGGNSNLACVTSCNESFNDLVNSSSVTSTQEGADISTIDAFTKEKNPKWKILTGVGFTLHSKEKGIVKLINVQQNIWQWESLAHGTISKQGFTVGGTVSYSAGDATVSFTPGTQNILYAGMSLNFTVTYSPICNCPGVSNYLPPVDVDYTSNAIWDAKPIN